MTATHKNPFASADWNDYAHCYDALTKLIPYQNLVHDVVNALSLRQNDVLLDAGCGTGNLLHTLGMTRSGGSLTGVDFSLSMLSYAKQKCALYKIAFEQADLNGMLPFGDNSFNKLSSVNVLYALDNPKHVLSEWHRVLTPGGLLVLATPRLGFDNGLILKAHCNSIKPDSHWMDAHASAEREMALIREALIDEQLIETMRIVAEHNRHIAQTKIFHFFSPKDLHELVSASGFTVISQKPSYANQGILIVAKKELCS